TASNFEYYLGQRLPGGAELNHLVDKARGAQWCTLANGTLEVESDWHSNGQPLRHRGYVVFYTPEYFRAIFPDGEILPPVKPFARQHCCIIRNGI
ncbi:MAG TPA: hypothetical protein VF747_14235, partial [Blastocatellia bacterium]